MEHFCRNKDWVTIETYPRHLVYRPASHFPYNLSAGTFSRVHSHEIVCMSCRTPCLWRQPSRPSLELLGTYVLPAWLVYWGLTGISRRIMWGIQRSLFAHEILRAGPRNIIVTFNVDLLFTGMPQVMEALNSQVDILGSVPWSTLNITEILIFLLRRPVSEQIDRMLFMFVFSCECQFLHGSLPRKWHLIEQPTIPSDDSVYPGDTFLIRPHDPEELPWPAKYSTPKHSFAVKTLRDDHLFLHIDICMIPDGSLRNDGTPSALTSERLAFTSS
jgi:hypothetical protein